MKRYTFLAFYLRLLHKLDPLLMKAKLSKIWEIHIPFLKTEQLFTLSVYNVWLKNNHADPTFLMAAGGSSGLKLYDIFNRKNNPFLLLMWVQILECILWSLRKICNVKIFFP